MASIHLANDAMTRTVRPTKSRRLQERPILIDELVCEERIVSIVFISVLPITCIGPLFGGLMDMD